MKSKIGGGVNRFADRRVLLKKKKSTRISDFEDPFCRLADFERSVVNGFLQYFSVDYGFCLF